MWYNPPYSKNVATNLGKMFLLALDKCFPPDHILHKCFNRNTVKLSYSRMPNVSQIVAKHNKKVLSEVKDGTDYEPTCNCSGNNICPVGGKCKMEGVIYQCTVKNRSDSSENSYVGLCEPMFKSRYNVHKDSFKNPTKRHSTKLAGHIWYLKDNHSNFDLSWKILSKTNSYSPTTKICNLCNREIYFIIFKPTLANLNKRNEIMSTCRHRDKFKLSKQK